MVFSIKYDNDKNIIKWYNISEFRFKDRDFKKKRSFDELDIPNFFESIDMSILVPIDNGEDFIFKYTTSPILSRIGKKVDIKKYILGYSFADILPGIKDFFYRIFKRVNSTSQKEIVTAYMYEQGEIKEYFKLIIYKYKKEIVVVVKDEHESYLQKHSLDLSFNQSPYIKTIMQDGKTIKVNKTHEKILGKTLDDLKDLTMKDYNKNPIISNETGLALSFEQIYNLVLNNEYSSIFYKAILANTMKNEYLEVLAKRIYFNGRPAVEYTSYNEERNIKNKTLRANNHNLLESYAKTSFIFHDLKNNSVTWGYGLQEVLGIPLQPGKNLQTKFNNLISKEDREKFDKLSSNINIDNPSFEFTFSIKTSEDNFKIINIVAHVMIKNEEIINIYYILKEITEEYLTREELIKANNDKTILIQEVHHRVKNNLQLIASFIHLEKKFYKDNPERIIKETETRINSLALIHERIYNEKDMNYIQISEFLKDFDTHLYLFSSAKDIEFIRDIDDDLILDINVVTSISLMTNELTTNSFKYAFKEDLEREKIIYKSFNLFKKDNQQYCKFIYRDSGVGLPEDLDVSKTKSLGWKIITSLVEQLDGEYKIFNDNGFNFTLTFPIKK